MLPNSISATALQTFESCPARYKAESLERNRGFGGSAATLGSSVHGALEEYVEIVYMNGKEPPSLDLLLTLFKLSYTKQFNSYDYETEEFADGVNMLSGWFMRADFEGVIVVSVEQKKNFDVPFIHPEGVTHTCDFCFNKTALTGTCVRPFNYIWDRFDKIGEHEFKVVDYKSNRWDIKPSDLKKKIQPRAYALACAIELKASGIEYDRIWVEFDMLRYGLRGMSFNRNDNAATWRFLKDSLQEIVDRAEDEFEEKLNGECLFCVRKVSCNALKKNILVGGIHSISTIEEAIDLRAQLEWQKKGLDSLLKDIDLKILTEAKERDLEEYESDLVKLTIGVSSKRTVDPDMVAMAIGDDLFRKYGSHSITMANIDKMLKGKELTDEQKKQLRSLIFMQRGNPSVKVESKNPIDED